MPSLLRALPSPVLALTVTTVEGAHASLASWVTQVSFEPRLVAVSLERESRALARVREAGRFALAALPPAATRTAMRIGRASAEVADKLGAVPFGGLTPGGVPLLAEATAWIECLVQQETAAGDHQLLVAEVVASGGEAGELLTLQRTGWRYAG